MITYLSQRAACPLCLFFFAVSFSCSQNSTEPNPEPVPDYQLGKNRYTTEVDGDTREYYVHVPDAYNANTPTPVVFMLHGSGGSGEGRYNNSGWKEVGETENILTVFPTSWHYCFTNIQNGQQFNRTLWNAYKDQFEFCQDETPRDDIKFLRQVAAELQQKFNVDAHRIYLVGFSSGAQMAFRCAVEMSDVFAAIVESAASHYAGDVYTPRRNLPITFQLGNSDDTWINSSITIPMALFDSLLTTYGVFQRIITSHTQSFDFEPTYTMTGDTATALTATFKGIPDVGNRAFHFTLINGLEHKYPDGVNHPMKGAEVNWAWLKQFTAP